MRRFSPKLLVGRGAYIHSMEAATAIPQDDELDEMDRNSLRSLAAEHSIPAGKETDAADLRRSLSRKREGGMVLACPNDDVCGNVWVYVGSADFRTSCPRCGSSVRIGKNRLDA